MAALKRLIQSYHKQAFLLLAAAILGTNALQLSGEIERSFRFRRVAPIAFPGLQFSGLEEVLRGSSRIGYYTDKNLNDFEAGRMFAQAQLVLAPVILEHNDLNNRYIIFDCADEQHAFNKIAAIGARPIKKKGGLILAERRP